MKSEAELKEQVKNSLKWRVDFAVKDVHAFMRAKSTPELMQMSNDFKDHLGGGNFLSSIAGVILLEVMAITLACIEQRDQIVTESDLDDLIKQRDSVREEHNISKSKLSKLNLQAPRLGTPKNLEFCIRHLDQRLEEELSLKLGYVAAAEKKSGLWSLIRNNLVHRFAPGWDAKSAGVDPGWLKTSPNIENDQKWFRAFDRQIFNYSDDDTVYVMGEFLVLSYLPRIVDWLCEKIDSCTDLESLQLIAINNFVALE